MISHIQLAPGLSLPIEVCTHKIAMVGNTGSGKTYAAGKLVEQLLAAGVQVVVVDTVGVWYGLRLAANGKDPGIPIPIVGGEHGDVPLESTAGRLMADVIVDSGNSLVLDVSDFTKGELCRFTTDFAIRLHRKKKGRRGPLLLVWDEAQDVVPQQSGPKEKPMVGAMERLIKQGRNFGIGTILITQRPQAVNKDVLNLTEVLFVYQLAGAHERKAMEAWITHHGLDPKKLMTDLPALSKGEGFIWSPQFLRIFQSVKVAPKATFDASATPTFEFRGHKAKADRIEIAPIDLDALRKEMSETIERTKADDPRELRRQVAELTAEVRNLKGMALEPKHVPVEVPILTENDRKRLVEIVDAAKALPGAFQSIVNDLIKTVAPAIPTAMILCGPAPKDIETRKALNELGVAASRHVRSKNAGKKIDRYKMSETFPEKMNKITGMPFVRSGPSSLRGGSLKVLTVIAQSPDGATREQITVMTGYKRSSRDTYIHRLKMDGFIRLINGGDLIEATLQGIDALGSEYQPLPVGEELRSYWKNNLNGGEQRLFEIITGLYPKVVERDYLSEATGYQRSSRDTYIQRLRQRRLIDTAAGGVRASDHLFGDRDRKRRGME